jgi:LysR family hydrogen peroxide-inducible transcriptional activator
LKEGHCLGDQVLGFCEGRDVTPKISFRSAQLETVQALVAAGLGISLIPAMATISEGRNLPQYRSLQSPRPQRKIVAVWPKHRTAEPCGGEFLQMVSARFGGRTDLFRLLRGEAEERVVRRAAA